MVDFGQNEQEPALKGARDAVDVGRMQAARDAVFADVLAADDALHQEEEE